MHKYSHKIFLFKLKPCIQDENKKNKDGLAKLMEVLIRFGFSWDNNWITIQTGFIIHA